MDIVKRILYGLALWSGLVLLAGVPGHLASAPLGGVGTPAAGTPPSGAAVRRLLNTVLPPVTTCRDDYAALAGYLAQASQSSGPGALSGYDEVFNPAMAACRAAQGALSAITLTPALRRVPLAVQFYHMTVQTIGDALRSLQAVNGLISSACTGGDYAHSPDARGICLAQAMEAQVQGDNVLPEFTSDLALARQLARSVGPGGPLSLPRRWSVQTNPTGAYLQAVSCPAPAICYAVGEKGTIVATRDGGATWRPLTSGTTVALFGIACPAPATCYAAGGRGTIVATRDGGATWRRLTSGTTVALAAITCPAVAVCLATGSRGTIVATRDGGAIWRSQHNALSGTRRDFAAITCATAAICYAVGGLGSIGYDERLIGHATILATRDGGATWQEQRHPRDHTQDVLSAVACPDPSVCGVLAYAVKSNLFLSTTDGGRTWQSRDTGVAGTVGAYGVKSLNGLACPTRTICYAVGDYGTIVATDDGGATWQMASTNSTSTNDFTAVACPTRTTCYAVGDAAILATTGRGTGRAPAGAWPLGTMARF